MAMQGGQMMINQGQMISNTPNQMMGNTANCYPQVKLNCNSIRSQQSKFWLKIFGKKNIGNFG